MSHTPGPWTINRCIIGMTIPTYGIAGAGITGWVADVNAACWKPIAEVEANARLIAAAPDLLKALQFYANESNWEKSEPQFACDCPGPSTAENDGGALAMAAIRKAVGE